MIHELAHVFNLDEQYTIVGDHHYSPETATGENASEFPNYFDCVMMRYDLQRAESFYSDIAENTSDALCDSCVEALWLSLHSLDLTV